MLIFLSWLPRVNISELLEHNIFSDDVSTTPYDSEAHLARCRHARPETLLIFYVLIEQSFTHCQTKLAEGQSDVQICLYEPLMGTLHISEHKGTRNLVHFATSVCRGIIGLTFILIMLSQNLAPLAPRRRLLHRHSRYPLLSLRPLPLQPSSLASLVLSFVRPLSASPIVHDICQ
jgi:hypothetical protein